MIMAIFAMSLDLLQGVTGLVSLGHAAYFGVAGYALAFLTPADNAGQPVVVAAAAVAVSGLVALVIGFFVVRTHGIYFIMVSWPLREWCSTCSSTTRCWGIGRPVHQLPA